MEKKKKVRWLMYLNYKMKITNKIRKYNNQQSLKKIILKKSQLHK